MKQRQKEIIRAIGLFIATFCSVFLVYGYQRLGGDPLQDWVIAKQSLAFAGALLTILLCHEMGHYLVGAYHGFHTSLPIFVPFPFALGTLGAIIKLKSLPKTRDSLLQMGAAGPISGFVVACLVLVIGLGMSQNDPYIMMSTEEYDQILQLNDTGNIFVLMMDDPFILQILGGLIFAEPLSPYATLHPIAFAGWIGCLLTAMNMLPMGQLDGGHIINALFPNKSAIISKCTLVLLFCGGYFWLGWAVWGVVALLTGAYKPIPIAEYLPRRDRLSKRSFIIAYCAIVCAILSFVPVPIAIESISISDIHIR